jgi:hypothetical protein
LPYKGILDPLNVDRLWKGCHCVEEVSSENFAPVTREAAGTSKSIQLGHNVHKEHSLNFAHPANPDGLLLFQVA